MENPLRRTLWSLKRRAERSVAKRFYARSTPLAKERISNQLWNEVPIKVHFLLSQPELWWANDFYELLERSPHFLPSIIVFPDHESHLNPAESMQRNMEFAHQISANVTSGWMQMVRSPEELGVTNSLIFVQQPNMGLAPKWTLKSLIRTNLVCYVPYGLKVSVHDFSHFNLPFHQYCWKIFAESAWHQAQFYEQGQFEAERIAHVGYPKFDGFKALEAPVSKKTDDYTIIIAPHWSHRDDYLGYATFEQYFEYWKQLTTTYPEIFWVLKPHPRLAQRLIETRFFSERECDAYFDWWTRQPNTTLVTGGNYLSWFVKSSAMLTDCGSFIAEYLPTLKPLLILKRAESAGFNAFGRMIAETFWLATSEVEIDQFVRDVVRGGNDEKYESRRMLRTDLGFDTDFNASKMMYDTLLESLS